ncbi:hypothetical protein SLEP1_g48654 [Rubroshorea leprosula]|uniref:Uncharacterized protein n=1 Tax=Rubroshorea leprosula TaxID=152421 RepID=A0AAV5LU91_9ROSI|nr:hypothetical protein SLEP1_g48654 [Rubroshorea leprosula]
MIAQLHRKGWHEQLDGSIDAWQRKFKKAKFRQSNNFKENKG